MQIKFRLLRPAGIGHGVQFPFVGNTQKHRKKVEKYHKAFIIYFNKILDGQHVLNSLQF